MKFITFSLALALAILTCPVLGQYTTVQPQAYNYSYLSGDVSSSTEPGYAANTMLWNGTPANMTSGICFKEVPVSSLPRNPNSALFRGNGSDPTMSRIQVCCEGYKPNENQLNSLVCDPICKNGCPNGTCTGPNKCVCLPGYVKDYRKNCVPTCPVACSNGYCQPDGSCICEFGFVLDESTKKFCRPYCSNGCIDHAWCAAPETCHCHRNYKLSPAGFCLPSCDNCKNGNCTAPGVCTCNRGYERIGNECKPICSRPCPVPNGKCTAPETCGCRLGYAMDASRTSCIPKCDISCSHGVCSGRNICTCNPGYFFDMLKRKCKPQCSNGCIDNAECVAPETCNCKRNYRLSPTGLCLPKCEGCTNGECNDAGVCRCHDGYIRNGKTCQPYCTRCNHGTCIAPETCSCKSGYVLDATKSNCVRQSQCNPPCLNGVCSGRNECTCKTGFVPDRSNKNVCKAHCSSGCPNGVCTLPNFCICKPGYKKRGSHGRQTCMRE